MILLEPFPIGRLHDEMLRTVIKAEGADIEVDAVMVFRFYTVGEVE